jgi:WXXGXW repeat (2 copies)
MRHILTKCITKSGINRLVYGGLASLMLAGGLALQPTAVGQVVINLAPPGPVVETVPPSRGPNWVWDPGHQVWRGGHYVWVHGQYIRRPHPGANWVPGHYVKRGPGYVWIQGHWA